MPRKYFTCGIYSISTPRGSMYIGSSHKIERRFSEHKSKLKFNKHHSVRLQNAFKKYGDDLKCEIVHVCNPSELDEKEQEYINKLNSNLNTSEFVRNVWLNPGTREKMNKTHQSEEWKKARSIIAKNSSTRWREVECSNGEIYKNLTEAGEAFGVRASVIQKAVKVKQISPNLGVKFKYKTDKWIEDIDVSKRAWRTRRKNKNDKHSKQTIKKLKKAKIGYKPSKKAVEASILKNSIPVIGVSISDGSKVKYSSMIKAAEVHQKTSRRGAQRLICSCVNGKKKTAYGYRWFKDYE